MVLVEGQVRSDQCYLSATEPGQPHSPPGHSSVSPCSEPRVSQFIKKYVASCLLISDTNTELSYILPSEAVKKGCFERLFQVSKPHCPPCRQNKDGVSVEGRDEPSGHSTL